MNGSSDDTFIVTYEGDESFNKRDTFTINDCTCTVPEAYTGMDVAPNKVTLQGNRPEKLTKPCTGILRVKTTMENVGLGATASTIKAVTGTVVDVVADTTKKVSSGLLDVVGNMLGIDGGMIKKILLAGGLIALLVVIYKISKSAE